MIRNHSFCFLMNLSSLYSIFFFNPILLKKEFVLAKGNLCVYDHTNYMALGKEINHLSTTHHPISS